MSNSKCQQTTMNLQWAKPDVKRQQQAFNGQNRVTKKKKTVGLQTSTQSTSGLQRARRGVKNQQ